MNPKRVKVYALVLLLILVLVACSQPTPEPEEAAAPTEPPPTVEEAAPTEPPTEPPAESGEAGEATQYNQAPMLDGLVASGELPNVDERLPDEPLVVSPIESVGQYGGTLRMMHAWAGAEQLKMFLNDPPVIVTPQYDAIVPNLFASREYSEDGLTLTWHLRPGLKWSDGEPFTSDDLMFWWEYMVNDARCATGANGWMFGGGDPATGAPPSLMDMEAPDDFTLVMLLPAKNYEAANRWASGFWEFQETNMVPAHYLRQFHPEFNAEISDCQELISVKNNWLFDPDYPTLLAWMTREVVPGERIVMERNPYYWKVDTQGNQLPYIDLIESRLVPDQQVRTLSALNGEVDLAFRELDPRDRALFLDEADRCNCRVLNWTNGDGSWPALFVNFDLVGDEQIAELLRERDFRVAMSVAIDRQRIRDTVWNGLGEVTGADVIYDSFNFRHPGGRELWEEWALETYTEQDLERANALLDGLGLDQRDSEGLRTFPDGSPLTLVLTVTDWAIEEINANAAALIQEDFSKIGLDVIFDSATGDAYFTFAQDAEWHLYLSHSAGWNEWLFPAHIFKPLVDSEAWPLVGQWYITGGQDGHPPEPGSPAEQLIELYEGALEEPDPVQRDMILWEAVELTIEEGPFTIGLVGNHPELVIASNNIINVTDWGVTGPWQAGAPGNAIPAQFSFVE